jgi:mono/diheme cytochrome c family protein
MKAALVVIPLAACDWSLHRMQDQPKCSAFAATDLLADRSCNMVAPDGIVGFQDEGEPRPPRTRALVLRGRDRFDRFCAPCHGVLGDGESDVARAMTLRRPPSLVDATVSGFDDSRIVIVITSGYGVMPGYRGALAPRDRWAVLEYVRVLQQRDASLDQLPASQREEAMRWLR